MRNATTVLNIIRFLCRNSSLESYVIRKSVMRSLEGGDWKSTYHGNSLVAYHTSCTVLKTSRVGDCPAEFNSIAPQNSSSKFTSKCYMKLPMIFKSPVASVDPAIPSATFLIVFNAS